MAGAQAVQQQQGGLAGFAQWIRGNFQGAVGAATRGWQGMPTGVRALGALGPLGMMAGGAYGLLTGQIGFQSEDVAYGQQIMGGNLAALPQAGRVAAMRYFTEQRMAGLETMTPQQRQALLSGYMGMTGVTDLGQVNMQLLTQAGQRAEMLGIPRGQAFQPFQQLAGGMGLTGTGMALQLAEQAPWGQERQMQQYLRNWGNVAPMMRQAGAMFGAFLLVPLSEVLRGIGGLRIVFYGLFLVIFIVALPEGIYHYIQRKYHQFERWVEVET